MLADGPDEVCGDPAEIEPPTSPTRPDRDQPHDHRGGAEAGGDKEDRLLRHRRRGGRHPQDSDEQLPTLHRQPAGDSGDILYLVSLASRCSCSPCRALTTRFTRLSRRSTV